MVHVRIIINYYEILLSLLRHLFFRGAKKIDLICQVHLSINEVHKCSLLIQSNILFSTL